MSGRPPKYETPEEMQEAIDSYFSDIETHNEEVVRKELSASLLKHPSVTGLTLALGFSERKSLIDYSEKDEFLHTIKKAKLRVENYVEERLYHNNAAGCIFNLKNNFGWKDKQEIENTGNINIMYSDEQDSNL
jgi:predicted adenine nucleotide alpha hydrolase (AANH) superfamily ATPase